MPPEPGAGAVPTRLAAALADRYRIEREVGAGGMATVYLARDLKHDRDVALKVLRPELAAVLGADRFLNEIRITARLSHPHILALIDSGAAEGFLYFVLPYVRGDSLRDRLRSERQLSLDETVRITAQVAGALDYAHRQGVIHRDIKPENILLQEGEAMLADFGIALAVKEAGGNRLTETGLSLGTPQYMSPEQATGDRTLDARSDVYSLGAVVYEMIAGEPPVSGASAQAIIAKLLTERPTRLRVTRDTVPEAVDDAVMRALAKVPSDRYASPGEFAAAIAAGGSRPAARAGRRRWPIAAAAALALLAGLIWWLARGPSRDEHAAEFALRDRTQLTSSGRAEQAAISSDGKEIAYLTSSCGAAGCTRAVVVQNVGEPESRELLTGLQTVNNIEWSPDRRNLLVTASVGGRQGAYLLSVFGGAPRFLSPIWASFFAGGDSIIMVPPQALSGDSVVHLLIAGLDGVPRDSIVTNGPVDWIFVFNVPGSSRFVVLATRGQNAELRVIDRQGAVTQRGAIPGIDILQAGVWRASRDAIWVQLAQANHPGLARLPFDAKSGRILPAIDTVHFGAMTGFDVTSDGSSIVIAEDAAEYEVWVTSVTDALRGRFATKDRVWRSSAVLSAQISYDGSRIFFMNTVTGASGSERLPYVLGVADGNAAPLASRGEFVKAYWADSVSLAVEERVGQHVRLVLVDSRNGQRREERALDDSAIVDYAHLGGGGGWTWIPADGQSFRVWMPGDAAPRVFPKPVWFLGVGGLGSTLDGKRIAIGGFRAGFADSLRFDIVDLKSSTIVPWGTVNISVLSSTCFLTDGSLLFIAYDAGGLYKLYRVRVPGRIEVIGTVPRAAKAVDVSRDLKRAAVTVREDHGDVWRWRVVRR
jgi:hypothetical protein